MKLVRVLFSDTAPSAEIIWCRTS